MNHENKRTVDRMTVSVHEDKRTEDRMTVSLHEDKRTKDEMSESKYKGKKAENETTAKTTEDTFSRFWKISSLSVHCCGCGEQELP